jgi:endonuclease/exonuclease/phosphatase family metal-dependent hydrolase
VTLAFAGVTAVWQPPERLESSLRVMTWNLWWRFGPWEARQPLILETIARVNADIVCLQEVWETRDGESQAATIAGELGYVPAYAAGLGLDIAPESLGNAILSRWPITNVEARALPAPAGRDELRVVLRAEIDGPRGPLEVFCTHLNWRLDQSDVRQMQVRAVCEFIEETKSNRTFPPILCGDFNADPEADEIRMLTGLTEIPVPKLVFLDAWQVAGEGGPGFTWSHDNPFTMLDPEPERRLDYVFVGYPGERHAGETVRCAMAGNAPVRGTYPSDHFAVVAEVRY